MVAFVSEMFALRARIFYGEVNVMVEMPDFQACWITFFITGNTGEIQKLIFQAETGNKYLERWRQKDKKVPKKNLKTTSHW
jgi:hypothetical protein